MTLKEISDNLDNKLISMQNQLNHIADNNTVPSPNMPDSVDTPNLNPPETDRESAAAYHSIGASPSKKIANNSQTVSQDSETQTDLDEATRQIFEETHEYKFQIFKLKERIREMDEKNRNELTYV